MLRASDSHAAVLLALLAPLLAGCEGKNYVRGTDVMCGEREELWREVLAAEASGDGGANSISGATTAAGIGGADLSIPEGCPDEVRVEPALLARRGMAPETTDNTLQVWRAPGDGECCYHVIEIYGVEGRPVRVDGAIILASLRREAPPTSPGEELGPVVAHWERVARLEHASVASFALLALDLMAHGAPLDLVADAQRASLDEVRHAESMFAHASRLGRSRVEAGAMTALEACRLSPDLDTLVGATILDGCVNETFASFEAAEQAARCADPDLARDLAVIAGDEARHAALGWRIVAWALDAGRTTPDHVARCLADAIGRLRASRPGSVPDAVERHGILASATREALVAEVCRHLAALGVRLLARRSPAVAAA